MVFTQEERTFLALTRLKGNSLVETAALFQRKFNKTASLGAICNLVKKLESTGNLSNMKGRGRKKGTPNTMAVLLAYQRNPRKPIRAAGAEIGINKETVRHILKANQYHPYKIGHVQGLFIGDPEKRYEFCWNLVNKFTSNLDLLDTILWGDEASWRLDGKVNSQNNRYWGRVNPDIAHGAPGHWALQVRAWLNEKFAGRWIGRDGPTAWPPRSPDLTPCHFWLWGALKANVYTRKPKTLHQLKTAIVEEFNAIPLDHCYKACQSVIKRMKLCMDKGGGQIRSSQKY